MVFRNENGELRRHVEYNVKLVLTEIGPVWEAYNKRTGHLCCRSYQSEERLQYLMSSYTEPA